MSSKTYSFRSLSELSGSYQTSSASAPSYPSIQKTPNAPDRITVLETPHKALLVLRGLLGLCAVPCFAPEAPRCPDRSTVLEFRNPPDRSIDAQCPG
ncbi:unnamed protein product [Heligmosomoides polygyrus]|uniref:Uncharacterized protein n=1 Tax=Heligmosomoides polygyrus TaxID=6339 RepID=A0A183GJV0_HELPZ|nr:unnamed protein product [Heligmosomoides polygyrus]